MADFKEQNSPLIEVNGHWLVDFSNPLAYENMAYWGLQSAIRNGLVPMKTMYLQKDGKLSDQENDQPTQVPEWYSSGDRP